jgi:CRP-like cAMP-binding protein
MIADHMMTTFLPMIKVYTKLRIIEYAHQSWEIESYKKGDILLNEGDKSEKLYIVKSG